jgi:hypothetical protein
VEISLFVFGHLNINCVIGRTYAQEAMQAVLDPLIKSKLRIGSTTSSLFRFVDAGCDDLWAVRKFLTLLVKSSKLTEARLQPA